MSAGDPVSPDLPAPSAPSTLGSRSFWGVILLAVTAAACLPFLPAVDGQFLNWDDEENFVRNQGYRGLGWAQVRWMLTTTLMGHWIPVTWLTLGLNYVLGGMEPRGYHLGNILLHTGSALVFCMIARRLLKAAWEGRASMAAVELGAGFAAVLFAAHPLRVESVAWITERRDVLSALFFLLSIWAYLRAVETGPAPGRGWYGASVAAYAVGLLAKASGMTLPLALLLLDVYPLGRRPLGWRRLVAEKLPHFALAGVSAIVALWALRQSTGLTGYADYGLGARLAMTAYSLVFYPWKWLWPTALSPMYELPARVDLFAARFLVPLLLVPTLTVALVMLRRRWPAGLAVWVYSAIMVLPVSGAVHAGFQLAHDRYSYLSGLGLALLGGGALAAVLRAGDQGRLRRWLVVGLLAAAVLLSVGLGAETRRQSRLWLDSETLWRWALDLDPACAICNNNLGSAILHAPSRTPLTAVLAESYFRRAIALRPERPAYYYNLGASLALQKRFAEAEAVFTQFARLSPTVAEGPGRLGMLYVDQERYGEAIPLLREALAMKPPFPAAAADLVRALRKRAEELARAGRAAEALALEREAAQVEAARP